MAVYVAHPALGDCLTVSLIISFNVHDTCGCCFAYLKNMSLHVSSPQFGGNFEFNTIQKRLFPNGTVSITSVKCEHVMFQNLMFDNIAK